MAIKTVFKDAVETGLPKKTDMGPFDGAANPSDGGSDLPYEISQYADLAPKKPVPYATGLGPVLKLGKELK